MAASLSDYVSCLYSSTPFGIRPSASWPFYNFTLFLSHSFFFLLRSFVRCCSIRRLPYVFCSLFFFFFFAWRRAGADCLHDLVALALAASHLHPLFFCLAISHPAVKELALCTICLASLWSESSYTGLQEWNIFTVNGSGDVGTQLVWIFTLKTTVMGDWMTFFCVFVNERAS